VRWARFRLYSGSFFTLRMTEFEAHFLRGGTNSLFIIHAVFESHEKELRVDLRKARVDGSGAGREVGSHH
jgi:hypothetical protein